MGTDLDEVAGFLRKGLYDRALTVLIRMISDDPKNWNNHYLAGIAYRAKRDWTAARLSYDRALELNPNEPSLLLAAGILEQQAGCLDKAIAFLQRALTFNPLFVEAHNSLGLTLKFMGRPADAIKAYTKGVESLIDSIIDEIAQSPEKEMYFCEAIADDGKKGLQIMPAIWERVRRALKQDIRYSTLQNNIGACHAELGDVDQARSCFQESIELIPEGVDYEDPWIGLQQLERS